MTSDATIYVAGGASSASQATMVGRAVVRQLRVSGFGRLVGETDEPDLLDAAAVESFFARARPEYVFVTAGQTAGIVGNERFPADLMLNNLVIASHVIPAAWRHGAKKLLYLSSSCTYPKAAPHPLSVASLWTGPLEPTSAAYAIAKLAGASLCDAYRRQHGVVFLSAIGADAYGPGDDFSRENSHVVGALIRRMHEARLAGIPYVEVWGSGTPRREFIYVDDLADACIFVMHQYTGAASINLGTGISTSIADLAHAVREVVGYQGEIRFDPTKPDGMPFKGLDSGAIAAMGWKPRVALRSGLSQTYQAFLAASGHVPTRTT
jgi:GDP-L-fucose synthase